MPEDNSALLSSPSSNTLKRNLTQRQLSMLAIGGAIGVGLFLGSSVTIRLAGPAVLVSHVFCALIAMIVAYALAEMAVVHPVAGSFGVYAETYLGSWAGFAVRATYAVVQIIAIGAEVTAVAIYFSFWFPNFPQWIWVVAVSMGLIAINTLQVGRFGEFEYWFALIKVLAIIAFIVVGLALIAGLRSPHSIGFSNLVARGGFFPMGWKGVWLALSITLTSYMGVEVVAVTAGEAEQPEKSIPRAMRTIVVRLILFYWLAMTVMLSIRPWDQAGNNLDSSPFVQAFATARIPYAASIMNLVVITAALSSSNTDLYLTTRMLFSLARASYLPDALGRVNRNGVPGPALAISSAGMVAAILLAIFAPQKAFLMLYGIAVAGMFFVWLVILITHLRFRHALGSDRVAALPMRLPLFPASTVLGCLALIAIAMGTFYVDGLQYTIPAFLPFLIVISIVYIQTKRRNRATQARAA